MNTDGSGPTNLTSGSAAQDYDPAWSPDGTKLAFNSTRDGNYDIYWMNADGSSPTRLTYSLHQDVQPEWAPDGSKLLFRRVGETFKINADGTGETNLTNTRYIYEDGAVFSPDGTKIVFASNEGDPNFEVWVMNADATGRTLLTNAAGYSVFPDWQAATCSSGRNEAGPLSRPIHRDVEPAAGPGGPILHGVSCDVLVPAGL